MTRDKKDKRDIYTIEDTENILGEILEDKLGLGPVVIDAILEVIP